MKDNFDTGQSIEDKRANKKAAMYVRMSTDHQKYSTENQADAIRAYAQKRNIEIVAKYADEGKSGLKLKGRDSLNRLISDVQSENVDFSIILVLDITRWGRFQDADESAYYEYICRRAGMDVRYVAEQFENDGSPGSTIIKSVKRAMAGEYSRELSKKVFAGQCRLIELGFRQGGPAGYGLRRMLVNQHGKPKAILKTGEHKSFQTDRVILVPGPSEEIAIVTTMYRMFIDDQLRESEIAAELNRNGVLTDLGRRWTRNTVHQILTNEKYIGNNVFNRTSNKLKKRHVTNSEDMWVRAEGAFEGIVDINDFAKVKRILAERNKRFSDEEMLERLKALHKRQGSLSGFIINEQIDMPSSGAYQHRFGSLLRAYKLIGYDPGRDYRYIEINKRLREYHSDILADTLCKIEALGTDVTVEENTDILCINDELRISIVICRCFVTKAGSYRWKIRLDTGYSPDITVAVRMDASNQNALDYYLLPLVHLNKPKVRLCQTNGLELDAFRFDQLDALYDLTARTDICEAA